MTDNYIDEAPRRTRVRNDADVLVLGGGPTGVVAAIAAARNGARTILTEQAGFLGGIAAAGLGMTINNTAPAGVAHGGYTSAFIAALAAPGPDAALITDAPVWGRHVWHDPELVKTCALDLARDAGVLVLLHSLVVGAYREGIRAAGAIFEAKGGRFAIRCRVMVDCTGDADGAACAGAAFEMADPARMQSANPLFIVAGVDRARADRARADDELWRALVERAIADGVLSEDTARQRIWWYGDTLRPNTAMFNTARVGGVDWLDPEGLTEAEHRSRRLMNEIVAFCRKYVPGFEKAYLAQSSPHILVRESRRIAGVYQMTEDDVVSLRKFPDGVVRCDNPVDDVMPGGHRIPLVTLKEGGYFQIPYRAMVPAALDGLLVAGRSISTTHRAQTAIRAMGTCMAMGEVAGTAAALAVHAGVQPRQAPIDTLLSQLVSQGMTPTE